MMIGIVYIAYGSLTVYIASWNVTELTERMTRDIAATGAPWEEWQQSFFRAGAKTIGLGVVTIFAGIGIFGAKLWGRAIWIILSPILTLAQFAQGQKNLTHFKSHMLFQAAWVSLFVILITWIMLVLPSSRKEFTNNDRTA